MRKVMIGTPAKEGLVDCVFVHSLVQTVKMSQSFNTAIFPIQIAYDALVQRARADLVAMALEHKFDDMIMIDNDQEWAPEWIFRLLKHPVDVVGGTVVKKSDIPAFNVKMLPDGLKMEENGLMEVEGVGTGFLRMSRRAMEMVSEISEPYTTDEGKARRWIFDAKIVNGKLVSEDNIFCHKWRSLGEKVWIDPTITCSHVGPKKWSGNFLQFLKSLQEKNLLTTEGGIPK